MSISTPVDRFAAPNRPKDNGSAVHAERAQKPINVLHVVDCYLRLTENWIYPQIQRVPQSRGRVTCRSTVNLSAFPLSRRQLLLTPPPWRRTAGFPRLYNSIAFRLGRPDAFLDLSLRCWPAKLLHAHFGMCGWETLELKRRHDLPLITSFYGYDAWFMPRAESRWVDRYRELFATGDLFLVEGPAMQARLGALGCPKEKILVHRIGVDLEKLPFTERNFAPGLKILMIGRFTEKKGLADGLEACARARSQGVNLTVTIVGDAPSADVSGQRIKQQLQTIASRPELAGRVVFTGFVPLEQTRALLATHNVFLCPSRHASDGDAEGGSPVILTEAMASGLLAIGTRHCDIPELILNEETGYLADEGDIHGLVDALCDAGEKGENCAVLASRGRKHVEKNFSLATQLAEQRSIYERATA